MDFGAILDKWEKQTIENEVFDKDAEALNEEDKTENHHSRERQIKSDASIDLHGLTGDEAWIALETFFENSRKKGFKKVLIIHGKGNHRNTDPLGSVKLKDVQHAGRTKLRGDEGVLRDLSRRFVESCSFAGKSGHNPAREGGTGATWVILKERD